MSANDDALSNDARRWTYRPTPSTWGDFGAEDALGRMNLVTPEKTGEGFAEVVDYQAYALGLPLTLPGGNQLNANRLPPVHRPNLRSGLVNANCDLDQVTPGATDVMNDDVVVLHPQYSTQWDALVHAGSHFDADGDGIAEQVYYNGFRPDADVVGPQDPADCAVPTDGGTLHTTADYGPLGIHTLAAHPVQGRAVMIDLAHHFGTDHRYVGWDDIRTVIAADDLDIRPGDIVTIHTGFATKVKEMNGHSDPDVLHHFGAVLNGRDPELLDWITASGIAAIAADNYAVEAFPALPPTEVSRAALPLHEHCLFKLGVQLGELWFLNDLAAALRRRGRTAFLLTAPPLNLPGVSGSPLNPIATI